MNKQRMACRDRQHEGVAPDRFSNDTVADVSVVGAGLAGCEAAFQLAERGIPVDLYEMKPQKMSPAHHSGDFCELVCSNSLRSDRIENAVGLLKAVINDDPYGEGWIVKIELDDDEPDLLSAGEYAKFIAQQQ